jgi:hypothetical protein
MLSERYILSIFILLPIFLNAFLATQIILGFFVGVIIFWILLVNEYKFGSSVSFLFAFFLLAISVIIVLLNKQIRVNQFSSWSYLFLMFGTLQLVHEIKYPKKFQVDYQIFLKRLLGK